VGNIPKHYTEEQLKPFFETVGPVVELVIMRDKISHESKGSAFVWYTTRQSAELAMQRFNLSHVLPDPSGRQVRPLVVRPANVKANGAMPGARSRAPGQQPAMGRAFAQPGLGQQQLFAPMGGMGGMAAMPQYGYSQMVAQGGGLVYQPVTMPPAAAQSVTLNMQLLNQQMMMVGGCLRPRPRLHSCLRCSRTSCMCACACTCACSSAAAPRVPGPAALARWRSQAAACCRPAALTSQPTRCRRGAPVQCADHVGGSDLHRAHAQRHVVRPCHRHRAAGGAR
jgi:hypothetical protein